MLGQEFGEYPYYLFVTGLIFYLFLFLITIFGFIFFNLISKTLIKNTEKIPFIERIFLSITIGLSIYISLSYFLMIFDAFNFYFAYLPLIIIDIIYVIYLIYKNKSYNLKISYYDFVIKVKKKQKYLLVILLTIVILIVFQFNLQWPVITKSKGLMYKDPYGYLRSIYTILDNNTYVINGNGYYPPGLDIYCAGALQISKDYIITFYFLKLASIHLLFLFLLLIFYLTLKIFKKLYLAFSCSILLLSFYLLTFRLNAFLSGSVVIFFIGVSLIIFMHDKKFLYLLGFFIPLIYFFNPLTSFYFILLICMYGIIKLFIFDRKNNLENIKIALGILIIVFLLALPYFLYIYSEGFDIYDLINSYIDLMFKPPPPPPSGSGALDAPSTEPTPLTEQILELFLGTDFSLESAASKTMILFLFLGSLGFLYLSSKEKELNGTNGFHSISKMVFLIIIASYIILFIGSDLPFFYTFHDRVFEIYSPFLIILCGFGIVYIINTLKKIKDYCVRNEIFKINIFSENSKAKSIFKLENVFVMILIPSLINVQLNQYELIDDLTVYYQDDYTVEAFLYLRENIPPNSKILIPDIKLKRILSYDMELIISPFNTSTTFIEFELFITSNSIDYLLLNKSAYDQDIFDNLSNLNNYEILFKNKIYYIYEIK